MHQSSIAVSKQENSSNSLGTASWVTAGDKEQW